MAQFTYKQGQYLAFIHLYRKLHRQGPSEADMVQYFRVSPPSVHQMIVKLEQSGLITREPGVPRSARVALAAGDDTSMALALAGSIATSGWDTNNQARRYVAWWNNGEYSVNGRCFDIGITTSSALSRFQETGDGKTSGDRSERGERERLDHATGPGPDPLW